MYLSKFVFLFELQCILTIVSNKVSDEVQPKKDIIDEEGECYVHLSCDRNRKLPDGGRHVTMSCHEFDKTKVTCKGKNMQL